MAGAPRLPSTPLSKGEEGRSPNERALRTEQAGHRCLWPSPDPIFINDQDGAADGTLISLTDDGELDGAEMLNDDISTQGRGVVVRIYQDET